VGDWFSRRVVSDSEEVGGESSVGVWNPVLRYGGKGWAETACRRVDGGCSTNELQGSHTTLMRDNCLKGGKAALCLQDGYGG